nr:hypothetical protein B0A51_08317 [Rachicladosporium sp. CCFEE 5018]OQO27118.1 hypothetical protein B0A51_06026 [Rachicladosporium sp. CCFEE 5018]OQO29431.1 hypothetical protein B0A51_04006 [Rachicladosporium sp. CCFEE 5018]
MGRKQNALIADYFRRGKKLEDNSNRYEQQCIKCGELFPKGRIDGMLTHLLKRCPQLTPQEREAAYDHAQRPRKAASKGGANVSAADHHAGELVFDSQGWDVHDSHQFQFGMSANGAPISDPSLVTRIEGDGSFSISAQGYNQQSALDTLAEASRRHLDYTQQRQTLAYGTHESAMAQESERQIVEQLLMNAIHQAPDEHNSSMQPEFGGVVSRFPTPQSTSRHQQQYGQPHVQPLVRTAQDADHRLQQSNAQVLANSAIDPQLKAIITSSESPARSVDSVQLRTLSSEGQTSALESQQDSLVVPPLVRLTAVPKGGRARFNEDRRRQVQETRKRGACLRCRMLKKPCSDGTPCDKCAHVDSARLWKWPCVRTKLADEFTLYSMSFHGLRVKSDIAGLLIGTRASSQSGDVEINFNSSSDASGLVLRNITHKSEHAASKEGSLQVDNVVLLDESDDTLEKISQHLTSDSRARDCISTGKNEFLRRTLLEAHKLYDKQYRTAEVLSNKTKSRNNHITPGQLLRQVTELWLLTTILVTSSQRTSDMSIRLNATEIDHQSPNYRLLRHQVLASLEARCKQICKSVLNELERHLLQRQQVSAFATFISAVILLSCVERMTSMYQILASQHPDGPSFWDSAYPPLEALCTQGPQFAALLIMLLRVRGLPPIIAQGADDTLLMCWPQKTGGKGGATQDEESTSLIRQWLEPCKLSLGDMVARRDTPGRVEDGWQGWDMRLIAAVLLPEGL